MPFDAKAIFEDIMQYDRWRRHALAQLLPPNARRGLLALIAAEKDSDATFYFGELLRFSLSTTPARPQTFRERYRAPFHLWLREKFRPWQPGVVRSADEIAVLQWLFVRRCEVEESAAFTKLKEIARIHPQEVAPELFALRSFAAHHAIHDLFETGPCMAIEAWFLTAIVGLSGTVGERKLNEKKVPEYRRTQEIYSRLIRSTAPTCAEVSLGTYAAPDMIKRFVNYAKSYRSGYEGETGWARNAAEVFAVAIGETHNPMVEKVAELEALTSYHATIGLVMGYGVGAAPWI